MENTSPNQSSPQLSPAAQNETLMGVLAYLGILVIIPFLMAKNNPFVKFHIKQGLLLVVIEIIVWLLGGMFLYMFWPILQIINLITLVFAIIGIVNVVNHKESELPIIGSWAHIFNNI